MELLTTSRFQTLSYLPMPQGHEEFLSCICFNFEVVYNAGKQKITFESHLFCEEIKLECNSHKPQFDHSQDDMQHKVPLYTSDFSRGAG